MRFLVNFIIVVMLVAGGWGVMGGTAHAEGKAPKLTSSETYVAVPPMNVSILRRFKMRGMLQIMVGLDVEDKALRRKATAMLPKLQDIYLRDLNEYAATEHELGRPVDVFAVSARLQRLTDEALGASGATLLISLAMVL